MTSRKPEFLPVKTKWGIFRLFMTKKGLYAVRFPEKTEGKGDLSGLWRALRSKRLDLTGYTPFQLKVYAALRKVPAGKTLTYGELAKRAGYPGAARAVGTAMRKNRLPVVIPCHRVVPASGPNTYQLKRSGNWGRPNCHSGKKMKSLGGGLGEYSAGKKWKRLLLESEKG